MSLMTFGVEIEFLTPTGLSQEQVARELNAAGVPTTAAGYTHRVSSDWKVVSDATVAGGHELVSPILTTDRIDEIDKVCAVLATQRCGVNRSCGLHVHIGARSLSVDAMKALALLYADAEPVIDSLLPPSRRASSNGYCKSIKSNYNRDAVLRATSATDIAKAIITTPSGEADRRVKLNYVAYWRHGTVEFRHHSGTIDPVKIKNWVAFCIKLVETAQREGLTLAPSYRVAGEIANRAPSGSYWESGRRTRTIYALLTRSDGATAEEIRQALGVRSRPDIRWHFARAREAGSFGGMQVGRRNGSAVFRMSAPSVRTDPPEPLPTLGELLERLRMTHTERTYWTERADMLAGRD